VGQQPKVGLSLFFWGIGTHTHTRAREHAHTPPQALLWTSDQPVAEAATYTTRNEDSCLLRDSNPGIKRLQTYALDFTATGFGNSLLSSNILIYLSAHTLLSRVFFPLSELCCNLFLINHRCDIRHRSPCTVIVVHYWYVLICIYTVRSARSHPNVLLNKQTSAIQPVVYHEHTLLLRNTGRFCSECVCFRIGLLFCNPITGLDRPFGFQEVEASRFLDSRYMKVVRLSAVRTGRRYSPGNIPRTHFC
jgi:hypothetical protein